MEPLRVGDGALAVGHGDDGIAQLVGQDGQPRTGIAVALDGDRGVLPPPLARPHDVVQADQRASSGRGVPAQRAAQRDRLAGDDGGVRAEPPRVLVGHPPHDLRVGVDVRGGHVDIGPDRVGDRADEIP